MTATAQDVRRAARRARRATESLYCSVCGIEILDDNVGKVFGPTWMRGDAEDSARGFCSLRCLTAHFARLRRHAADSI